MPVWNSLLLKVLLNDLANVVYLKGVSLAESSQLLVGRQVKRQTELSQDYFRGNPGELLDLAQGH